LIIFARAGRKEWGWRVSIHQEFLPALASCPVVNAKRSTTGVPPPPNFVPVKLARRLKYQISPIIERVIFKFFAGFVKINPSSAIIPVSVSNYSAKTFFAFFAFGLIIFV